MKRIVSIACTVLLCLSCLWGCGARSTEVKVVTSQAMVESGLFDALAQEFSRTTQLGVKITALDDEALSNKVSSGKFDAALVKSNSEIQSLLEEGKFKGGLVFYDTLYLIGPKTDPAGIRQFQDKPCSDLFRHIALTKSRFVHLPTLGVSRLKEQEIWKAAEITPEGDWYLTADAEGEDALLKAASQKRAYAVIDRTTYEKYRESYPDLVVLQQGIDDLSDNYYCLYTKEEGAPAQQFSTWLQSDPAQKIIEDYHKNQQSKFLPASGLAPKDDPAQQ